VTSSFAQSRFWAKSRGRRVANRQALAIGRDPIALGNPYRRRGSVPGEDGRHCRNRAREIGKARHSPATNALAFLSFKCSTISMTQIR